MTFTRGTTRDAARFIDTLNTLSRYVVVQVWSQSTVTAKAMIEMVAPSFTQPLKPVRMYYVTPTELAPATDPMTKTVRRFVTGTVIKNVAVDDDIDWKMTLSEWIVKGQKYQNDTEAWTENSARVYNLVLGYCRPELRAEMQNHSMWAANAVALDCIVLLLMVLS